MKGTNVEWTSLVVDKAMRRCWRVKKTEQVKKANKEVSGSKGIPNHRFIEEKKMIFALCGSSARKLKRAGVNLLAGRAVHRAMHPFVPSELGADFDLERAMGAGLLPLVWNSEEPSETLAAYARMYLKEEIQAEAVVRNLPGFARFLPVAALFHGQVLNITNISRDAGVARTTAGGYLEILEETLLAFRIPAHEFRLKNLVGVST